MIVTLGSRLSQSKLDCIISEKKATITRKFFFSKFDIFQYIYVPITGADKPDQMV